MTAAVPHVMNHPTDQTLAAFVDETIPTAERQNVIKHMADCAECRDVVLLTTEIAAGERGNVKQAALPFAWKVWVPLAAAAAIAAVVVMPLLRPDPMDEVVKTARKVSERPNESRLSLDVPYQRPRPRPRGGEVKVGSDETALAALTAADRANADPTVGNLEAAGVAMMYYGKREEAVRMLELAVGMSKTPSVALLNNLTAAYLGNDQNGEALATADRSLSIEQTLVALWNRALALERLNRDDKAIGAWRKYLEMDSRSQWAGEARERLNDLGQLQQLR